MTAPRFYNSDVYVEHYLGVRWPTAIWAAVLGQAVRDITVGPADFELRGLTPREAKARCADIRAAAEAWIADEVNEPRRFVWVCEQLALDPVAVRRSIKQGD